jgi:putative flippase GtrA
MVLRFLRFNVVAVLGIGVRLLVVWALVSGLGLHYLTGTALAVEASVLHNFFWHLRWTWGAAGEVSGGRKAGPTNRVFFRCVAFHGDVELPAR